MPRLHVAASGDVDLSSAGLFQKWHFYAGRYGVAHAMCRFVGTKAPRFWHLVGARVTRRYLRAWMSKPGPKLLNLGGGGHCTSQFLTADVDPRADVYVDMMRPLPFPSASFDGVFLEEAIEHVPTTAAAFMLRECARVCKPGAVVRIATPDMDWFCRNLLDGTIGPADVNAIFYEHEHRHIYSRAELAAALAQAGFADITPSSYKDASSELGYLDTHADRFAHKPEISQYVEARRPAKN